MTVDIHDGHDLGESDEGETHGAVLVEQRQPVLAGAGGEDEADGEAGAAGNGWGEEKREKKEGKLSFFSLIMSTMSCFSLSWRL